MRNDSIETLLLRHYGGAAPAPVDLEQQLSAMVRTEAVSERARQQALSGWNERRVSRRKILQLVTFTSAGISALAVGVNALQGTPRKPAYSF
jgi:hypothetical protein